VNNNFLPQFFDELKSQNLQYSVLRNYQYLPNSTGGSDLDMLINKADAGKFLEILKNISKKTNGAIISVISSEICPRICLAGSYNSGWGVMIDLHYEEITYRGYTILSNNIIWKNTYTLDNGVSVLGQKADALVGLFKELLNNGTCQQKYYDDFKKLSTEESFLKSVFGDIGKEDIISPLLHCQQNTYSDNEIHRLNTALNKEFPRKSLSLKSKAEKFERFSKQPGYSIAFLGTDGSGKSTIIEKITPTLNDAFHNAVYYEHMRPNRFPSIARLMGKKEEFSGPVTNPHGSEPSGFLGSLLRWFYYMLDYTFGFYLKVWPKKAIRSCVWIFDRYYYDYLIDPKRGRINLPQWILKLGQFIIPEPDIILCLGADAETIHNRKPELTLVEVERQVAELKRFCSSHKRAVWIDTAKSIEQSSTDAMETIIKVMAKRFESVKLNE